MKKKITCEIWFRTRHTTGTVDLAQAPPLTTFRYIPVYVDVIVYIFTFSCEVGLLNSTINNPISMPTELMGQEGWAPMENITVTTDGIKGHDLVGES